jgi:crotonyl-CoA carboxylase/reductase
VQARRHGRDLRRHDRVQLTIDARYIWMHQKRMQGSHFAHLKQAAAANKLMVDRRIDPCMSEVFPWDEIPKGHMPVLVCAPRTGLRTFEDVIEACEG